jgi:dTMP kinase
VTWIAFEGGDGCGKSTQARLLAEQIGAVLTREPGGTAVGERIREVLLDPAVANVDHRAEALLMAADRAQNIAEVVGPALDAGRHVVSDRSAFSSFAYQGYGRELDVDALRRLSDWAMDGRWPDVVVLLEVDADTAGARMTDEPDRLEAAGAAFHARVRGGFSALAVADPTRWVIVDGTGTVDEVAARVWSAVQGKLT